MKQSGFELSVVEPMPEQSQQTQTTQPTNHNSKQMHTTNPKRGKTRVHKARLVWVFMLCNVFQPITERNKAEPKQTRTTMDSELKTALVSLIVNCGGDTEYVSETVHNPRIA